MSSFLSYGLSLILAYATDNVVLCLEIATLRFVLVHYCTAAPQRSHRRRPSPRQLALVLSFPNHCSCHPPFLGARDCSLQPVLPTLSSSSWRKLSSYLRLWPMRFWMNFWTWAFPLILLYSLVNSPSECLWDLHQAKYNSFSSQPWDLSQGSEISLAPVSRSPISLPFCLLSSAAASEWGQHWCWLWIRRQLSPMGFFSHLPLETSLPQEPGFSSSLPLLEAHQVFH